MAAVFKEFSCLIKLIQHHYFNQPISGFDEVASVGIQTKASLDLLTAELKNTGSSLTTGLSQISTSIENAKDALDIVGSNINTGLTSVATNINTAGVETKTGLTKVAEGSTEVATAINNAKSSL